MSLFDEWTSAEDIGAAAAEARENAAAVSTVVRHLSRATIEADAIRQALETVRTEFGWAYGSFWAVSLERGALTFGGESGDAGEEFRRVTRSARFAHGVGVAGRTWQARDMIFVEDLGAVTDCVRAPAARRAGVRSGVCLPLIVHGSVIGTLDFFATERVSLSGNRSGALRNTASHIAHAVRRIRETEGLLATGGVARDIVGTPA